MMEKRQDKIHPQLDLNNLPGMVYQCLNDQSWTMKFVSGKSIELTGYTPDELINNKVASYEELILPEFKDKVRKKWQDAVLNRTDTSLEYKIKTKDGKIKWVLEQGRAVFSKNGEVAFLEGFIEDITARKRAEEELRAYTERFRSLRQIDKAIINAVDSSEKIAQAAVLHVREMLNCQHVSIGIFDFENDAVKIFAANGDVDSVMQVDEILPEEFYGNLDILRQNKLEIIEDSLKMEICPVTNKNIHSEDVRSYINAPIAVSEDLIGVLSICWANPRNITLEEQEVAIEVASQISISIKKAREQAGRLQEKDKHFMELEEKVALLEASNKELESFSYSVSHDLRAPLRHINGYVELLNQRYFDDLPDKARHYLETISDASSKMGTLIDDLLKYSRTGRKELMKTELDLNVILKEVLDELKPVRKGREITWDIQCLPKITGDYSLMKQVWVNLLDNAVKYTRSKKPAKITVAYKKDATGFVFCVCDNGVGFDMKYSHKLFGVFQRLHSQTEFEGTGIGLANVQRIIHKHMGRVWAEAKLGEGAKFYFSLPIKKEEMS